MQPIRHQSAFGTTEHGTDVCGVFSGGVEIGVIADSSGQLHGNLALRYEHLFAQRRVVSNRRVIGRQQIGYIGASFGPIRTTESHKSVQSGLFKCLTNDSVVQQAGLGDLPQIENEIANGNADMFGSGGRIVTREHTIK